MNGYLTSYGYRGPSDPYGHYILYATEDEYIESVRDEEEQSDEKED